MSRFINTSGGVRAHRVLAAGVALVLVSAALLSGCGSAAYLSDRVPEYATGQRNLRSFATVDELSQYLRSDSDAGPLLSAHRGGAMRGFPENCLATMDRTLRYAAALFEVDVRMSRDSVLVLMHDETLERTTTGAGPVASSDLAELRRLLLRDKEGAITPFHVPTLAEVLSWSEDRAVVQLDVKDNVPPSLIVETIRRHSAQNRVVVLVYDLDHLIEYTRIAPELMYSAVAESLEQAEELVGHPEIDTRRLMAWTGLNAVSEEVIAFLRQHHIRAVVGTFGLIDRRATEAGPEVYRALFDRGVGVVATDLVPLAARALPSQP